MTTTDVTTFSLKALIREVAETSPQADPRALAAEVAKMVPEEHLRDALGDALFHTVRHFITNDRSAVTGGGTKRERRNAKLTKWDGVGELYARILGLRVDTTDDGWKFLGDCTQHDIANAVAFRKKLAKQNMEAGQRYQALLTVMVEAKAEVVADAPQDKVMAVFA